MALMSCPECGNSVSSAAVACPSCGHPISLQAPTPSAQAYASGPPKSRSVAIVLALFLGGIGAHKFYVNKPGAGLLYLVFCWTFIPVLISLLEVLQYLSMNDETFQRKLANKTL